MPSELTEPTLEELSAYIDGELDETSRERVEQHLATCDACHARVDGLRDTAHAIRGLPMESPPRRFTVPKVQQRSWSWAPVGWLGASAAAVLVIIFGVHQLYNPVGTMTTASTSTNGAAAPPAAVMRSAPSPGAEAYAPVTSHLDQQAGASKSLGNATSVSDPRQPARSLELSTDSATYSGSGTMTVLVRVNGLPSNQSTSIQLFLERGGYAVELVTPSSVSTGFQSSYALARLPLSNPVQGTYTLLAIEQLPGGDGATLVARLPVTIK